MKKMKKYLSMLLALAMVLSMATTAFAIGGGGGSGNTPVTPPVTEDPEDPEEPEETYITELGKTDVTVTGTTTSATIKIKMSTEAAVVVNPYGLEVNVGTEEEPTLVNKQLISATQWIENLSDVPLDAKIDITGTEAGQLKLAVAANLDTDDALKSDVVTNTLLMYFEAETAADVETEPTWKADYKAAKAATQDENYQAKLVAVSSDNGTTPGVSIAKMTMVAPADNAKSNLAYHFAGEAVKNPTTPWAADDTVSVALAFTFSISNIS